MCNEVKVKVNETGISVSVSVTWDLLEEGVELITTMLQDEKFIAGMTEGIKELIENNS